MSTMGALEDPFRPLAAETVAEELLANDFAVLAGRAARDVPALHAVAGAAVLGRLHGFDLQEQPLLKDLPTCPGQIVGARTTVALRRAMVGSEVLVLFEGGDPLRPVITGVIQTQALAPIESDVPVQGVNVHADDERYVLTAEREIVLRCGDASITLTRAGKVIIKGNYILSRSTGYNKMKGAAIDLN